MTRKLEPHAEIDRDGVRTSTERRSGGSLGRFLAAGAFAALVLWAWTAREQAKRPGSAEPSAERGAVVVPGAAQSEEWASVKQVTPRRAPEHEAKADEPSAEPPPEIDARDVIPALIEAGETGGIAAFPPPGTDPVKRGLVVPDDYQLPEGYVRHYQVTDDGKSLEPILMFSPDYEFLDQNGKRIALPDDLVVPPELAPPGLPIRTLDVPEPGAVPGR